jgi:SAM-dependent methyltransferase
MLPGRMLTVAKLTDMMKCPACGHGGLELREGAIACRDCGHSLRVEGNSLLFESAQEGLSAEWQAQQDVAVPEYEKGTEESVDALSRLFGGFMAISLRRDHKVLDIGCGITREVPPYVRDLGLENYIGLEPLMVSNDPHYPKLLGAIAEALPIRDGVLDAVMFATSMDHIEDIDGAVSEAKRVVGLEGRLYMWIGIYDPDIIARTKAFHNIMLGSRVKKTLRFLAAHVEYSYTLWQMKDRRKRLAKGIRIDPYHCRYYTRENVGTSLAHWGLEAVRSVEVPNTASLFVEARPA